MIRYLEIDEILELHFWIIEDFGGYAINWD